MIRVPHGRPSITEQDVERVAAVVAKDRHILSTGYNGTPRGV